MTPNDAIPRIVRVIEGCEKRKRTLKALLAAGVVDFFFSLYLAATGDNWGYWLAGAAWLAVAGGLYVHHSISGLEREGKQLLREIRMRSGWKK